MRYHTILYLIILFGLPKLFAEEVTTGTSGVKEFINSPDTDRHVAARLATYTNCSKNGNNPVYEKMEKKEIKGEEICYTTVYTCQERGTSGKSSMEQHVSECFKLDDLVKNYRDSNKQGNGDGSGNGDGWNDGSGGHGHGDGGIIISDGSDFCSMGAGCGNCRDKCYKYFTQGKKKDRCIKCLEKNGYYCLASILYGNNRSSCMEGGYRYTCSGCRGGGSGGGSGGGGGGGSVDYDCSVVSKNNCHGHAGGGGSGGGGGGSGGKNDDCPDCNKKPYPPGTGFLNVMTGLGNFLQGVGAGFGASGLGGWLGLRECRKWYTQYNKDRIATDNPLVDWECEKYTSVGAGWGGWNGGAGVPPYGGGAGNYPYPYPPYGTGGYGYNPNFPGNFGGPWGNYNPYGGLGMLGGLLNGGININAGFNGGINSGFGSPYTQPWFNQGANGLPWGNSWGAGGGYGGYGNGYGNGWYNSGVSPNGAYSGGSYWQDVMIQEQARREAGYRYFMPAPVNSSWQYMYPR